MKWHKTSEELPEEGRECLCRSTEISRSKNVYYTFCICEFESFPDFDEFDQYVEPQTHLPLGGGLGELINLFFLA